MAAIVSDRLLRCSATRISTSCAASAAAATGSLHRYRLRRTRSTTTPSFALLSAGLARPHRRAQSLAVATVARGSGRATIMSKRWWCGPRAERGHVYLVHDYPWPLDHDRGSRLARPLKEFGKSAACRSMFHARPCCELLRRTGAPPTLRFPPIDIGAAAEPEAVLSGRLAALPAQGGAGGGVWRRIPGAPPGMPGSRYFWRRHGYPSMSGSTASIGYYGRRSEAHRCSRPPSRAALAAVPGQVPAAHPPCAMLNPALWLTTSGSLCRSRPGDGAGRSRDAAPASASIAPCSLVELSTAGLTQRRTTTGAP